MNKTTLLLAMATTWPAAALFYSFHFRSSTKKTLGEHRDKDGLKHQAGHGLYGRDDSLRAAQRIWRRENAPVKGRDAQNNRVEHIHMGQRDQAEAVIQRGEERN